MRRILMRLVFPLLAGAFLAGCVTTGGGVNPEARIVPLIDVPERKAELAALAQPERAKFCHAWWESPMGTVGALPELDRRAVITGAIEYQQSNAQHAGNILFGMVEAYYGGNPRALPEIRKTLEEGSRIDAFTVVVPYSPEEFPGYNPMNEPVFQVANFLVPLAHAYLILKAEFSEEVELIAAVKRWGDRLFEVSHGTNHDFKGGNRGIDRRVTIGAGWASWGNVAENRAALDAAYRYYIHAMAGTGKGGADKIWLYHHPELESHLYYVNVTISAALVTAHALNRSGARDAYTVAPGGGTVVEGAAWLWKALLEEQDSDLFRTRYTGSRGVAWAELFVHEFPDHPAAASMDAWLATRTALYLNMGGGPTTCLYRRVPHQA